MSIRRIARFVFRLIVVGFVLLFLGFAALVALLHRQLPESVTLPGPLGPYAVGRQIVDWVDDTRIDPFAPAPGTKRELSVCIWYPADPNHNARAEYLPKPVRVALRNRANPVIGFLARLLTVDQANVTSHALERPDLSSRESTFPIILMKPGYGGLILQYSALAEDLASHGYVVVGSDSPHTTPVVVYQDGRIAIQSRSGHPSEGAPGNKSRLAPGQPNDLALPVLKVWADDERFVVNRLQQLNKEVPSNMFSHRLNMTCIGALGHSFGGAASLQFCKDDERCKAAMDIDGAIWGDIALGGLRKPALFLFSDRPILKSPVGSLNPDARALVDTIGRIRSELPNKPNRVILQGSKHYNFADSALLSEPRAARFLGTVGPIDRRRALEITRKYVRAFFDTYLKGKPSPLVQGASELYPEVLID